MTSLLVLLSVDTICTIYIQVLNRIKLKTLILYIQGRNRIIITSSKIQLVTVNVAMDLNLLLTISPLNVTGVRLLL